MKAFRLVPYAAAAALALCASGAHATGAAFRTTLSDVHFGVIDLTPDDNVAAGYSYSFVQSSYGIELRGSDFNDHFYNSGYAPVSRSVSRGSSFASLDVAAVPGMIDIGGSADSRLDSSTRATASAYQAFNFTLAANTVLTLDGHLFQQANLLPAAVPDGRAESYVSIWLEGIGSDQSVRYFKSFSVTDRQPAALNEHDFWLSYANPTDHEMTVAVRFNVNSMAKVSPVPEPSAFAMLGVGLLAVGAAARHRQTSATVQGERA